MLTVLLMVALIHPLELKPTQLTSASQSIINCDKVRLYAWNISPPQKSVNFLENKRNEEYLAHRCWDERRIYSTASCSLHNKEQHKIN